MTKIASRSSRQGLAEAALVVAILGLALAQATAEEAAPAQPVADRGAASGKASLTLNISPTPLLVDSLPIVALAMSSQSDRLASCGDGSGGPGGFGQGMVRLWDVKQLKEVVSYPTERGVCAVAISPDGRLVAWSSWARDVVLQTVEGAELMRENVGHPAPLAFSPDGKSLVAATEGQKLLVWNVATGKRAEGFQEDTIPYHWVGFSPDGKLLVAAGERQGRPYQAAVWDAVTRQQLYRLQGHQTPLFRGAISPDSQTLATSGGVGICLWDLTDGRQRQRFNPQVGDVNANAAVPVSQCLAFSPDGLLGASAGLSAGSVLLWDPKTGQPAGQFTTLTTPLRAMTFTRDGKTLVTGSMDGSIRVWNVERKQQIGLLQEPRGETDLSLAVAYAPDGASVAAGLADGRIRVFRLAPAASVYSWQAHGDATAAVAYSADGRLLASGGYENDVKLWNPATGELVRTLKGHQGWSVALAFSPDGRTLASGGYDRTIILWNVEEGTQRLKLSGHTAPIRSLAFAHEGSLLASGGADGTVRLWDAASGEPRATLSDHKGVVRAVAFSADDRLLASGGEDRVVRLWNVETHDLGNRLAKHTDVVTALTFIEGTLVSASLDHSLTVWDVATGKPLTNSDTGSQVIAMAPAPDGKQILTSQPVQKLTLWGKQLITSQSARTLTMWEANQVESESLAVFGRFAAFAWSAAFSSDGASLLVAAGGSGNSTDLYRYQVTTGKEQFRIAFPGNARTIDVSPVGDLLALGCATDRLLLIEASTGRQVAPLETEGGHVNHAAFSADGKWLFTAALDNQVRIYNVGLRGLVSTLRGHNDWALSVAVSPDQKRIVSTCRDGTAIVWDLESRLPRYTLPCGRAGLESVAWSPDGKTIVTGGNFGAVNLWHAQTGAALRSLVGSRGLVYDVNFSPDGKYLVTAGEDHLTRVWNLSSDAAPRILGGHTGPVTCARFSPDGKRLVTTSTDGTARLWDVTPPAE